MRATWVLQWTSNSQKDLRKSTSSWIPGPKIHKQNIPLWPILSIVGSAQHRLAKWLADILEPVLKFYSQHCISDSFTFANQIQNIPIDSNNSFFFSFEIVSLCTNFSLDETIAIVFTPYTEATWAPSCSRKHLFEIDAHCYQMSIVQLR